jgi:hypothetical protein
MDGYYLAMTPPHQGLYEETAGLGGRRKVPVLEEGRQTGTSSQSKEGALKKGHTEGNICQEEKQPGLMLGSFFFSSKEVTIHLRPRVWLRFQKVDF